MMNDDAPTTAPETDTRTEGGGPEPTYATADEVLEAAERRTAERFVTALNNPNPPTVEDFNKVKTITSQIQNVSNWIELLVPECRDKSLALTALEDVLTRASRGIYVKTQVGGSRPALVDGVLDGFVGFIAQLEGEEPDPDSPDATPDDSLNVDEDPLAQGV